MRQAVKVKRIKSMIKMNQTNTDSKITFNEENGGRIMKTRSGTDKDLNIQRLKTESPKSIKVDGL